jgi:hypothetical protein
MIPFIIVFFCCLCCQLQLTSGDLRDLIRIWSTELQSKFQSDRNAHFYNSINNTADNSKVAPVFNFKDDLKVTSNQQNNRQLIELIDESSQDVSNSEVIELENMETIQRVASTHHMKEISLDSLGGVNSNIGIIITGEGTGNYLGYSVSLGQDTNGDGKGDFALGAPYFSSSMGKAYLIYGSSYLDNIALSSITTSQGISLASPGTSFKLGWSVAVGGDANGDGKADVIVGGKIIDVFEFFIELIPICS